MKFVFATVTAYIGIIFLMANCQSGDKPLTNKDKIVTGEGKKVFELRPGDLLFQDLDCGDLCDAIEAVTEGVDWHDFSHVGMVAGKIVDTMRVIEAIGEEVVLTNFRDFFERSSLEKGGSKILVGRLKGDASRQMDRAVTFAKSKLGEPYDDAFIWDNDKWYCSELIYEAYRAGNEGEPMFQLERMTFKDPATGTFFEAWVDYYNELGIPIPEGEPGLNPGSMSRNASIMIVHDYSRGAQW